MNFFKKLFSWGKKSSKDEDEVEKEIEIDKEKEDLDLKKKAKKRVKKKRKEREERRGRQNCKVSLFGATCIRGDLGTSWLSEAALASISKSFLAI